MAAAPLGDLGGDVGDIVLGAIPAERDPPFEVLRLVPLRRVLPLHEDVRRPGEEPRIAEPRDHGRDGAVAGGALQAHEARCGRCRLIAATPALRGFVLGLLSQLRHTRRICDRRVTVNDLGGRSSGNSALQLETREPGSNTEPGSVPRIECGARPGKPGSRVSRPSGGGRPRALRYTAARSRTCVSRNELPDGSRKPASIPYGRSSG